MSEAMADEFLSVAEVRTLAGPGTLDDQQQALTAMGIPFKARGKRILVSRYHTREWLAGRAVAPSRGINLALVK